MQFYRDLYVSPEIKHPELPKIDLDTLDQDEFKSVKVTDPEAKE